MADRIACKVKAPFRLSGILYDAVGSLVYLTEKQFNQMYKAKCVVKVQDPRVLEPETETKKEASEEVKNNSQSQEKKSYSSYNKYKKK